MRNLAVILFAWLIVLRCDAVEPARNPGQAAFWGDVFAGHGGASNFLSNAVLLSGNSDWAVGMNSDGAAIAWGANGYGQTNIPAGTYTNVYAAWTHGIGARSDGSIVEWGGPYGNALSDWTNLWPAAMKNNFSTDKVIQVAGGDDHSAALTASGKLYLWGGRVQVTNYNAVFTNVKSIASGWYAMIILRSDGTVTNVGTVSHAGEYIHAHLKYGYSLTNIAGVSAGPFHFMAWSSNGTAYAWGTTNTYGEITVPASATNVVSMSGGQRHTVAARGDGSVVGWGTTSYGEEVPPAWLVNASFVGSARYMPMAIMGRSWFVATNGSDSAAGTLFQPFRTVQHAMDSAAPGDHIYLAAGDYGENLNPSTAGTQADRIVIDGQGVASITRVTLDQPGWSLINLRIGDGTWPGGMPQIVRLLAGAHFTTIANCYIDGYNRDDISGIYVNENGTPYSVDDASDCLFENNYITRLQSAASSQVAAIYMLGTRNVARGNTITNVTSIDVFRVAGRTNAFIGNRAIDLRGSARHPDVWQVVGVNGHIAQDILISGNWVQDGPDYTLMTIEMDGVETRRFDIFNNVFIRIGLKLETSIPDTRVINNLFYQVGTVGGTTLKFGLDLTEGGGATNGVALNNAFIDCGTDGSATTGWYDANTAINETITADYNFVSKGGAGVSVGTVPIDDPSYDFQEFYEIHGINGGNPGFVDEANLNFTLLSASPLIDAGTTQSAFSDDIRGAARPSGAAWDIGPYEGEIQGPVVWLKFEDTFTDGILTDSSGNAAHALRYGWGVTGTNWPTQGSGTNGTYAAHFTPYYDSRPYSGFPTYWDGQYAAVTNVPSALLSATNFSVMLWARFDDLPAGRDVSVDHNNTFLNSGWDSVGCWMFGRYYSTAAGEPKFLIVTNGGDLSTSYQLSFPQIGQFTNDVWRHYAVTVDCTTPTAPVVTLYTNGVLYATHTLTATIPHLTMTDPAGAHPPWLALSCWTHNTTPELGVDKRPNAGWMHGAMDDVRIYSRILTGSEVAAIAGAADAGDPPSPTPTANIRAGRMRAGRMR
jgi:hypothetical protein